MEFEHIMKLLVQQAKAAMLPTGLTPLFSWDNNKIQKTASLTAMGLTAEQVLSLPNYSPDMHKAIEHAFAQLKHSVQQQLLQPQATALTARQAQQLVEQCFFAISKVGIFKDVCSLPNTYFVIAGDEGVTAQGPDGLHHVCSGGNWPARQYR